MTNHPQETVETIPDEQVVPVLALLLDAQSRLPDPAQTRQLQARLVDAAQGPEPVELADDDTTPPTVLTEPAADTGPVSELQLARIALVHLLTQQPDLIDTTLPRALQLAAAPPERERLDPATLAVTALVLVVLQTDVDWTRSSNGRWKLRVHKRAMSDSTLATLIRGLFTLPQPAESSPGPESPAP